ncbi:hypothetical protein SGLAM104S_02152 [Streptomyces glaucescens]|jgi:hypothetical protein
MRRLHRERRLSDPAQPRYDCDEHGLLRIAGRVRVEGVEESGQFRVPPGEAGGLDGQRVQRGRLGHRPLEPAAAEIGVIGAHATSPPFSPNLQQAFQPAHGAVL